MVPPPSNFNSRGHRGRTETILVVGGFVIIAALGCVIIWLVYGAIAALVGLFIIVTAIGLFSLFYFLLKLIERWLGPD